MRKIAQPIIREDEFYNIIAANGKVVEVADGSSENGAAIQVRKNKNEAHQQWQFVPAGESAYFIRNRETGKMLDLMECGVVDGTWLHQWEGVHGSSQIWMVEFTNDGHIKLKNNISGKCLDIVGMSQEDGARLQIWQDVNGENQLWSIKPARLKKARAAAPRTKKTAKSDTAAHAAEEKPAKAVKTEA